MPYRVMKESLNAVIDSLSDGILVTDGQGKIILYNQKAEAFLGIMGKAALDQPVQFIKNDVLVRSVTKILTLNMPYYAEEVCLIDTGNTKLRVHVNPVRDTNGLLIGSVTLLHDVAQLSAIDKIKSNFLAMVSHQLKSPLSSTLLQTSILLDGMLGEVNEKQKDLLQKIKAKLKGMTDLVNDVLDVCFIEEGVGYVAQIELLNLSDVLQRAIELIQPQAHDKNITLQATVEDKLPLINGNKSSMEALFLNLISNAVKFTPSDGQVSVKLRTDGKNIQIKVSDTGIGIKNKDIVRIYEKFYREKSERTKHISGTGLGLAIVKGVVDAHNGFIYVDSVVGKGTTFTVVLPIG